MMEDRIGMALAVNRIGVNNYNINKFDKSVEYHLKHLELSDIENSYAAYYNLGITYRNIKNYDESTLYFTKALEWALYH